MREILDSDWLRAVSVTRHNFGLRLAERQQEMF